MKKNEKSLYKLRIFNLDIEMEFHSEKYAMFIMKRGKRETIRRWDLGLVWLSFIVL